MCVCLNGQPTWNECDRTGLFFVFVISFSKSFEKKSAFGRSIVIGLHVVSHVEKVIDFENVIVYHRMTEQRIYQTSIVLGNISILNRVV